MENDGPEVHNEISQTIKKQYEMRGSWHQER
jgi:hypothetical protein